MFIRSIGLIRFGAAFALLPRDDSITPPVFVEKRRYRSFILNQAQTELMLLMVVGRYANGGRLELYGGNILPRQLQFFKR